MADGTLVVEKDFKLTHTLVFPITNSDGKETVAKLTYKPRLMVRDINVKMKGIKAGDNDGRVVGYVAALTDQPSGVLTSLDTEDNGLAQAIAMFFL